jgi:hypothetical protein
MADETEFIIDITCQRFGHCALNSSSTRLGVIRPGLKNFTLPPWQQATIPSSRRAQSRLSRDVAL